MHRSNGCNPLGAVPLRSSVPRRCWQCIGTRAAGMGRCRKSAKKSSIQRRAEMATYNRQRYAGLALGLLRSWCGRCQIRRGGRGSRPSSSRPVRAHPSMQYNADQAAAVGAPRIRGMVGESSRDDLAVRLPARWGIRARVHACVGGRGNRILALALGDQPNCLTTCPNLLPAASERATGGRILALGLAWSVLHCTWVQRASMYSGPFV